MTTASCPDLCGASLPADGWCCDRCGWTLDGGRGDPRLPSERSREQITAEIARRAAPPSADLLDPFQDEAPHAPRRVGAQAPAQGAHREARDLARDVLDEVLHAHGIDAAGDAERLLGPRPSLAHVLRVRDELGLKGPPLFIVAKPGGAA